MIPPLSELRDFAADIAHRAGQFTLEYFNNGVAVDRKADQSPVTEADRGAEKIIREAIRRTYPSHGMVGEEYGEENGAAPIRWVIDPIDGTKAFIRGLPTYSVLVGVEVEGRPVAGAAYLPALDELYCAADGCGVACNSRPIHVSSTDRLDAALVGFCELAFLYRQGKASSLERMLPLCAEVKTLPDAYGLLMVAAGRADAFIDASVSPWDVCALYPIVREAGGQITDWSGNPNYFTPNVIGSNSALHEVVLRVL